jgi:hypothetical protein
VIVESGGARGKEERGRDSDGVNQCYNTGAKGCRVDVDK